MLKKTFYKNYKKSVFKSERQFWELLNWSKYFTQFIYLESCFSKTMLKKRKTSVHYWVHCYIGGGWFYNSDCYKWYGIRQKLDHEEKFTRFREYLFEKYANSPNTLEELDIQSLSSYMKKTKTFLKQENTFTIKIGIHLQFTTLV